MPAIRRIAHREAVLAAARLDRIDDGLDLHALGQPEDHAAEHRGKELVEFRPRHQAAFAQAVQRAGHLISGGIRFLQGIGQLQREVHCRQHGRRARHLQGQVGALVGEGRLAPLEKTLGFLRQFGGAQLAEEGRGCRVHRIRHRVVLFPEARQVFHQPGTAPHEADARDKGVGWAGRLGHPRSEAAASAHGKWPDAKKRRHCGRRRASVSSGLRPPPSAAACAPRFSGTG